MSCDSQWTVRFHDKHGDGPLEARPAEMSLQMSRVDYDYCRLKFPREVGDVMKQHTRYSSGALNGRIHADVCYNGDAVQRLMFRPDWVTYGHQFTHVKLHDLQKALADGTVDIQRDSIRLVDIYQEVVSAADNRLISHIKFSGLPEEQVREIGTVRSRQSDPAGATGGGSDRDWQDAGSSTSIESNRNYNHAAENSQYTDDEDGPDDVVSETIDADFAVDFDSISPEKALTELNKKYNLRSWVDPEGILVVGLPEDSNIRHIAASDDERVWRYKEPQISHNREPIKSVMVEGAWVDEPGLDLDVTEWFDEGGTDDVKAYGLATRNDVNSGSTFMVNSSKAKRDALQSVAELALKEKMKQENAGTIEIDPAISGTRITDPITLRVGDRLHLVPPDELFYSATHSTGEIGDPPDHPEKVCGNVINNEEYIVTGVTHEVNNSGKWEMKADIALRPDPLLPISTSVEYYEPEDDMWLTEGEFYDGSWIEDAGDGWF